MKKILALLLALCMVFALAACGESAATESQAPADDGTVSEAPADDGASGDKVIKIGVFEPQSGDNGAGGKQEILGMQYANSLTPTVDIGGETYTVELVYADNGSSADKAPSAAQQLVSEGVSVVLGSYGSGVSIAGSQYFADAGIPAIGVTCTNPNVTLGNDYYFRVCYLDPFQGSVLATLRGKLITSASGVLFGLLGKLGDKDAINAAADSLGCHIYLLYRLLHRAAGGSTAYFALPEEDCAAGAASAGASLARTDYARALAKLSREKAAFPDMSHETLNSAFPGRSQGMIQVLSTADGQLNRLNQSGLK